MQNRIFDDEEDMKELRRKAPQVIQALERIPRFQEAQNKVAGHKKVCLGADEADISNKLLVGCIQLEIEHLREMVEKIVEKYPVLKSGEIKWRVFAREKEKLLFKDDFGKLVKVPLELLDLIVNMKSFDGTIEDSGDNVKFISHGKTVCEIPKSLIDQLRADIDLDKPLHNNAEEE